MKILFIFLLFIVYFALSLSLESTKAIGLYLIISLVLFFWGVLEWQRIINGRNLENRRRLEELLAEIPHTESLSSDNLLNVMLIDDVNSIFYLLQRDSIAEDFNIAAIPFSQVLEVAIVEDERVLNLYPKDGILESTLENDEEIEDYEESDDEEEEEDESIEALSLKIVVDDIANPILEYPFIQNEQILFLDSEEYSEAISICNEWYQKICIIIKRYEHSNVAVRLWQ
ncbi:hypothetical protein SAMN05518871_11036 [Psychrobacillus sp. OK028]|uniref:hypothetical protein n=1 Tax=Psychrobacillus sp. OK028 TaxID=1884359 RepID=UPI000889E0EE|nr:hypothetical protein [Psychrobacillus sp. OK028]SDO09083.1 hypothetical protein SAMN05518871_11036 [Psychrobacillus sp. OK028]